MSSAPLVALLACACAAELYIDDAEISALRSRGLRAIGTLELPHGCMSEGRWFGDGATVRTREACLLCICSSGALSCRRRACAPLPEPPPRCHILHRRGECCPELHCPDRIMLLEHGASARYEDNEYAAIATPASIRHVYPACVEGGTVYAAGSAMSSNVACEQCFCLGGARRCVRPQCLPPPPGCKARPAPGACCPQRYYCAHVSTSPPNQRNPHDCEGPDGRRVAEGERVLKEDGSKCTQCFCLRGSVRCQHLSCAPPLLSCTPLVQPGQCCPHQYQCHHLRNESDSHNLQALWQNTLGSIKNEDRSFHSSKANKRETTVKVSNTIIDQTTVTASTIKNTVAMIKVKRKTDDIPALSPTSTVKGDISITNPSVSNITDVTTKTSATDEITPSLLAQEIFERVTTDHPDATVKIMINGTINCTTELSSTSLSLNVTNMTDTDKTNLETLPRVPYIDISNLEAHTFSPNDIITDRNAGFDENETFTINVTSSLRTNSSLRSNSTLSTTTSTTIIPPKIISESLFQSLNISKKTKEDYDYDYTEPTLPPSLPNLKIIPFVAADAVIEDEISSKESLTFPVMEREDKFPVYYPGLESKDTQFPTRREDVYHPTQYPVFVSKKIESPKYPLSNEAEHSNVGYPGVTNDLSSSVHEYTVTASLGGHVPELNKVETKMPTTSATFEIETPPVNLFSPPVETEGGFIPKGPGIIDEYYAVYQTTPGLVVPHLTTSMQLDTDKGECTSSDGRRVPAGAAVSLACSICTCAWGELHCTPRPCHTPPGCKRRLASTNSVDLCCGELICDQGNKTTPAAFITSQRFEITLNESKIPDKNYSESQSVKLVEGNKTGLTNHSLVTTTSKSLDVTVFKNESVASAVSVTTVATLSKATDKLMTTTTTANTIDKNIQSTNHSLEYDDDEEDDEGFSFGSVLKLLLSDNYDATTASSNRKKTTPVLTSTTTSKPKSSTLKSTTPIKSSPLLMMDSFIPVTHRYPYSPPKNSLPQNSINRIDHLVLGEATAIKTTPRPVITTSRPLPLSTTRKIPFSTEVPLRNASTTSSDKKDFEHPVINEVPRPTANSLGVGPGLLKLAGCNIYGRMYRVGRIIAELSTPCQECRCTEIGVQCRALHC